MQKHTNRACDLSVRFFKIYLHSCAIENIKNVSSVIGSISELSLSRMELINGCEKEITHLKSLLKITRCSEL